MFLSSQPLEYTPLVSRLITETVDTDGNYTYSNTWYDGNNTHSESEVYIDGRWEFTLRESIGGVETSDTWSEYDLELPVLAVEYDDDMNEAPPHMLGPIFLINPAPPVLRMRCSAI